MKPPRIDVRESLAQPTVRSLLDYLSSTEEPVRARDARESLKLSIAQLGLSIRALERHGLALRRHLPAESGDRQAHVFLEATEQGREQARVLAVQTPRPPAVQVRADPGSLPAGTSS